MVAASVSEQRHAHVAALLGEETASRLTNARILVVGAGGIGCELLKNLAMVGVGAKGTIDIIDLDTIDLSNLNRQLLFQKQHIGQPKAIVARDTVLQFHPNLPIRAFHDTIFAPQYGFEWIKQFDLVLNALDNLDARRWVNRLCVATRTPLVESGTTGFWGQVQPILPTESECYDCTPKPTPKSYPVCTIRSTPSQPIHVIVWAKSWLFPQLFGADDQMEEQELQKALANGENAEEISKLQAESGELKAVRDSLNEPGAAERLFNKLFVKDVQRLLARDTMWKTRAPPTPLNWVEARKRNQGSSTNGTQLKDHQSLTFPQTLDLFESSLTRLSARRQADPEPLSFDKDDDDVMDFVTASANLRGFAYNIPRKTRFETKEMAGNIIPAIASTNAIVAAQIVAQAVHILSAVNHGPPRFVHLTRMSNRVLSSMDLAPPNKFCPTSPENYGLLKVKGLDVTLRQVFEYVALRSRDQGGLGFERDEEGVVEVAVYNGTRLLTDVDMDDNLDRTLDSLQIQPNSNLTFTDEREQEEEPWAATNLYISVEPELDAPVQLLDFDANNLRKKVFLPQPNEQDEDGDDSDVQSVGDDEDEVEVVDRPEGAGTKRKAEPDEAQEAKKAARTEA